MIDATFVDTNILVYVRDAGESIKQKTASVLIATLWRERRGCTSMQVLNEYYVTVTRKLRPGLHPDEAWDDVQSFFAWSPQKTDSDLLLAAREVERRYRISWWDSLIVGAAQLQNCSTLLTEDLQDGMSFGNVMVRNPFVTKAKISDATAAYDVPPKPLSRHPRRGRPRKISRAISNNT